MWSKKFLLIYLSWGTVTTLAMEQATSPHRGAFDSNKPSLQALGNRHPGELIINIINNTLQTKTVLIPEQHRGIVSGANFDKEKKIIDIDPSNNFYLINIPHDQETETYDPYTSGYSDSIDKYWSCINIKDATTPHHFLQLYGSELYNEHLTHLDKCIYGLYYVDSLHKPFPRAQPLRSAMHPLLPTNLKKWLLIKVILTDPYLNNSILEISEFTND